MCMFSQPILSVQATRIFARLTGRGSQFLVYQMKYSSDQDNAMILPLPVRQPTNAQSLRFIDLQNYESFFDDLERGFPLEPPAFSIGCGEAKSSALVSRTLQVFNVGNFVASFVPTMADFSRLDPRFNLSKEAWDNLPSYQHFGFAVFQLASGNLKPHPMALEFEKSIDGIFFPTVHVHDGAVHPVEEFDHLLYTQHAGFDSQVGKYSSMCIPETVTGFARSKFTASKFCKVEKTQGIVRSDLLVHRRIMQDNFPNKDVIATAIGDPEVRTLNLRPLLSLWPVGIALAALTWFVRRRMRLTKKA